MNIGVIPVQLADYLSENLIFLNLDASSKLEAFQAMVTNMAQQHAINQPQAFLQEVIARENLEPTCIGRGVAFPHTRTEFVDRPVIAFARTSRRIHFNSSTNEAVNLIFMLGTPKNEANEYLEILARLCRLLRRPGFRQRLLSAHSPKEILQLFYESESPHN